MSCPEATVLRDDEKHTIYVVVHNSFHTLHDEEWWKKRLFQGELELFLEAVMDDKSNIKIDEHILALQKFWSEEIIEIL